MNKGLPTYVPKDKVTGPKMRRWIHSLPPKMPLVVKKLLKKILGKELPHKLLPRLGLGTPEHYYHFLIGYLLPLIYSQKQHCFKKFLVLNCGPLMTPILQETLSRMEYNFEFIAPDSIQNPVFLEPWDSVWYGKKFDDSVRKTINSVEEVWKDYICLAENCPKSENLLLKRSTPHKFYLDGSAQNSGYGTSRRALSNIEEVSDFLTQNNVIHSIYEPGVHCLGCQIQTFRASKRLLGFRGAEWANLIWATKEARVRMLDHDPPARTIGHFMNRLGIRHEFFIVESSHSPENPHEALRFFKEQ